MVWVWWRECSKRVVLLNRVVRKGLINKVMVGKRSEGSEAWPHVAVHERRGPDRRDPEAGGCLMCSSDSQETSVLGTT